MEKVSADTIARLTEAAALAPPPGPAPSPEQLKKEIHERLKRDVDSLAASIKKVEDESRAKGWSPPKKTAFTIAYNEALEDLREFEEIMGSIPKGFRLAPVLFSRISSGENDKAYEEYASRVRPKFLQFLAEKHAGELKALGICRQGIERMKHGLNPTDEHSHLYDVNVDHIIERFGGGSLSKTQETDPDMPPGSRKTRLVNHFANFVLLPTEVHETKNKLNALQRTAETPADKPRWVLMIVPENIPGRSGYVALPQGETLGRQKAKLSVNPASPVQVAQSTLEQVFCMLDDAEQRDLFKPALEDMAGKLSEAFNAASKPDADIKAFQDFYDSKKFKAFVGKTKALPAEDTEGLRKALRFIDGELGERFNGNARKPANNNTPRKKSKRRKKNRNRHHRR